MGDRHRNDTGRCGRLCPALARIALTALGVMVLGAAPVSATAAPAKEATITTVTATPQVSTMADPVTYTALVRAASGARALTGTVTFTVGSTQLCAATVVLTAQATNRAQCRTTETPVGTDTVTATYSGDPAFAASSGTTTVRIKIHTRASGSAVRDQFTSGLNKTTATYTAVIRAPLGSTAPTGRLSFTVGSTTVICYTTFSDAYRNRGGWVATGLCRGYAPGGTQTVNVGYSGDVNFAPSSATFTATLADPNTYSPGFGR